MRFSFNKNNPVYESTRVVSFDTDHHLDIISRMFCAMRQYFRTISYCVLLSRLTASGSAEMGSPLEIFEETWDYPGGIPHIYSHIVCL